MSWQVWEEVRAKRLNAQTVQVLMAAWLVARLAASGRCHAERASEAAEGPEIYQEAAIAISRVARPSDDAVWPCSEGAQCIWIPLEDAAIEELLARREELRGSAGGRGISFVFHSGKRGQGPGESSFLKIQLPATTMVKNQCDEVISGEPRTCHAKKEEIPERQRGVRARVSFATDQMSAVLLEMPPHKWIRIRATPSGAVVVGLGNLGTKVELGMRLGGGSVGGGSRLLEAGDVFEPQQLEVELYNLGEKTARLLVLVPADRKNFATMKSSGSNAKSR
jgi:hypothetical protein